MSEDSRASEGPPDDNIFSNLPDSRPGARSPRRKSASGTPDAATEPRAEAAKPAAQPESEPDPLEPAPAPRGGLDEADAPRGGEGGGIEDLAWAGVAVAAEAATLGVRLASRALEAVRGTTERR